MFKRETYTAPKGAREFSWDYKKYEEKYEGKYEGKYERKPSQPVCHQPQTFPYKTIQTYKTPPSKLNYTGVL